MNRITRTWSTMRRLSRINLIIGSVLLLVFGYVAVTLYFGAASQVRYSSNDFPGAKKASTAFLTAQSDPTPHRLLQSRHRRGSRR